MTEKRSRQRQRERKRESKVFTFTNQDYSTALPRDTLSEALICLASDLSPLLPSQAKKLNPILEGAFLDAPDDRNAEHLLSIAISGLNELMQVLPGGKANVCVPLQRI